MTSEDTKEIDKDLLFRDLVRISAINLNTGSPQRLVCELYTDSSVAPSELLWQSPPTSYATAFPSWPAIPHDSRSDLYSGPLRLRIYAAADPSLTIHTVGPFSPSSLRPLPPRFNTSLLGTNPLVLWHYRDKTHVLLPPRLPLSLSLSLSSPPTSVSAEPASPEDFQKLISLRAEVAQLRNSVAARRAALSVAAIGAEADAAAARNAHLRTELRLQRAALEAEAERAEKARTTLGAVVGELEKALVGLEEAVECERGQEEAEKTAEALEGAAERARTAGRGLAWALAASLRVVHPGGELKEAGAASRVADLLGRFLDVPLTYGLHPGGGEPWVDDPYEGRGPGGLSKYKLVAEGGGKSRDAGAGYGMTLLKRDVAELMAGVGDEVVGPEDAIDENDVEGNLGRFYERAEQLCSREEMSRMERRIAATTDLSLLHIKGKKDMKIEISDKDMEKPDSNSHEKEKENSSEVESPTLPLPLPSYAPPKPNL